MIRQAFPAWLHPHGEDVMVDVLVAPSGARTRIMGVHDDRLKVQLTAPPVDGKANEALVRFLAKTLELARAQISIVGGPSSRRKTVRISGVQPHFVYIKLSPKKG